MKLHSKIYGDKGQDLIVIHGLFGMSDNWNTLGKKFSKYCKVYLIDLRNHGRSPHSTDRKLKNCSCISKTSYSLFCCKRNEVALSE